MSNSIYPIISKAEAKSLGLKHYFTGKKCKNGHLNKRWITTGHCIDCNKNDRDKSYKNNITARRLQNKNYASNNKDVISKATQKWNQDNPHRRAEISRIRFTKLKQAIPVWYEEDLIKLLYMKRNELNALWGTQLEVDHIIPLNPRDNSVCGLHCWANLQLLDKSYNSSKIDVYQRDW